MSEFEELIPSSIQGFDFALKGVSGHRIACDLYGDGLYVVGGWNYSYIAPNSEDDVDRRYVREIWKFNISTRIWTRLRCENPPSSLASHCLTNLGPQRNGFSSILLIHGESLSAKGIFGNNNEMFIYDTREEHLELLTTSGALPARLNGHWFGQAMAKRGDYVYVATGRTSTDCMELHRLNLNSRVWEALSVNNGQAPASRVRHEIVVDQHEKVYILGGAIDIQGDSFDIMNIPYFSVATGHWLTLPTLPDSIAGYPKARSCFGCVMYGDCVYVVAGHFRYHNIEIILDDLWRLHLPSRQWSKFSYGLPRSLWFHAVDVDSDGVLYVYGGCFGDYVGERSTKLWRTRLVICPLKRLAWDTIAKHIIPNMHGLSPDEILKKFMLPNVFLRKLRW